MANFYENKGDRNASWEAREDSTPTADRVAQRDALRRRRGKRAGPVQAVVAEWIKRLPAFDFPDDEIG